MIITSLGVIVTHEAAGEYLVFKVSDARTGLTVAKISVTAEDVEDSTFKADQAEAERRQEEQDPCSGKGTCGCRFCETIRERMDQMAEYHDSQGVL